MASHIGKTAVACSVACLLVAMIHIGIQSTPGELGDAPTMQDEAALVQKELNIHRRAATLEAEAAEDAEAEAEESQDTDPVPAKRMSAMIDEVGQLCVDAPLQFMKSCLLGPRPKKGDPKKKYYKGYRSPFVRKTMDALTIYEDGSCTQLGYGLMVLEQRKDYKQNVTIRTLGKAIANAGSLTDQERADQSRMKNYMQSRCALDVECGMFVQTEGRLFRKKNPDCDKFSDIPMADLSYLEGKAFGSVKIVKAESDTETEEASETPAPSKKAESDTETEEASETPAPSKKISVMDDKDEEDSKDDKSGAMSFGRASLQLLALLATAGACRAI